MKCIVMCKIGFYLGFCKNRNKSKCSISWTKRE